MIIKELKEIIRTLPGNTELLFFPESESDEGEKLHPGLGYFDKEENELVYIGSIQVMQEGDEN